MRPARRGSEVREHAIALRSIVTTGSPEREPRPSHAERHLSQPDCPIDHDAAERVVQTLPGPVRRGVYLGLGSVSVVAGVIGIALPLWPTTCFLLLAGWCFARSSQRAERWLHRNRLFGRYLRDYRERGIVSSRMRRASVAMLWICIGLSAFLLAGHAWAVALLLVIAGAVTLHLYSLPTDAGIRRTD